MDVDPEAPPVIRSGGCFPLGFAAEARQLFTLAWPLSLSIFFHYLVQPISLAFCGHLGRQDLAGVALALSVIYVTSISFGRGLAFVGDTYFSQSFGSRNKSMVGVYLQRLMIFGFFMAFPIWAIQFNVESILLLIKQEPIIAKKAQEYVLYFMPGVLAYNWLFILMRYLVCQNRVIPNFLICVVSCFINAILHYGLVYQARMGIRGSAISLATTYWLVLFQFFAYIWGSRIYKDTWDGWSWACLHDWGPLAKTSINSIVMTFLFWICTESGTYMGGILGDKQLSAFSIMFQVEGFAWMLPLGLGGACAARVGQFLGANQPVGASNSTRVSMVIVVIISVFLAVTSFLCRNWIPMLFTGNREVIDYTVRLIPILSLFLLLEGIGGLGVSIFRGSGRQFAGVVVIFVSYYVFAIPIGAPLMFLTNLGLAGIWWGYVIGLGIQCVMLWSIIFRMNWREEAEKAQARAGLNDRDQQQINRDEDDEPLSETPEETGLLGSAAAVESHGPAVLRCLLALLLFVAVAVAGYVVSVYVHVAASFNTTDLCVPSSSWHDNTSLPVCADTVAPMVLFG